jgi:hypothetical protein
MRAACRDTPDANEARGLKIRWSSVDVPASAPCLAVIVRNARLFGEDELAPRAKYGRWRESYRVIMQGRKSLNHRLTAARFCGMVIQLRAPPPCI